MTQIRLLAVALLGGPLAASAPAQILIGGQPNPAYAGFHAWFDATDGVNGPGTPVDGTPLTSWVDRTGNGNDLVRTDTDPTRRPTFAANGTNGLPVVHFDGDDYVWGDGVGEFGTLSGGQTYLVVVSAHAADGGYVFDSSSIAGRNALMTGQMAFPGLWQIYAGSGMTTLGPPVTTGTYQVHAAVFDSGSNAYYIDGVLVGTGTEPAADMVGMILGARYTVSNLLSGNVAEVLAYDVVLPDGDREALQAYLSLKWIAAIGTSYCIATQNSTGTAAVISASGGVSVTANNLALTAMPVPDQPGLFFYGPNQTQLAFGNGFRCVDGIIGRLPVENASGNVISHAVDNTQPPNASTVITPASTWNFQCWYRDPAAGGASFNLSGGLEILFTP